MDEIFRKIEERSACIGIVGLGYVGLPLALAFCESGFKVLGFEIDEEKVKSIKNSESYLKHLPSERIKSAHNSKKLDVTLDFKRVAEMDAMIICVPTPLDSHHAPNMSYVRETMDQILPHARKGQIFSLESTVYPGATEEELTQRLEKKGLKVGVDCFVLFSPEREDPGNPQYHTTNIPKVVGGSTPHCLEVGALLYKQVIAKIITVSSTRAAEMAKLLENIYRAVNIGLVNELKIVADRMGINIWEVIDAASTKPFGFTPFFPGPGLGGHCIPIDPFYLTWKAKEFGVHTRFIELAGQVNRSMPEWVVEKINDGLNASGKPIKGSRILVLGVAYKKNIDDMRESPALELIKLLDQKGAAVQYIDPFVRKIFIPEINKPFESVELNTDMLKAFDCVLIATDHDAFDYELVEKSAGLIVDTRGRFPKKLPHVVHA